MLGAVDNGLHLSHYYVVRNAGLGRCHCTLHFGAEPRVVGGGVFADRELRLSWQQVRH